MRRGSFELPPIETLEGLVIQIWDVLACFRSRLGNGAYAEASFEKDGKRYTVRITEEQP